MKKRFGDRRDARRVRDIDGLHNIMILLKPNRCDSDVYINHKIDVTELIKYVENKNKKDKENKLTYFHAFSTAIVKLVYNRPLLNRYIINGHFYDRDDVSLSFVAKVKFEDNAEEFLSVINTKPNDNINTLKNIITNQVKQIRSNKKDVTDDVASKIGKLPKCIRTIIVWFVKQLDKYDLLPYSMIKNNIYYSSVLVSNLGSIDCGAIYHNLTNFGTNSILVTIGKIHKEAIVNKDGKVEIRDVCEFGVNCDERIADGVYFAKSIKIFEYIISNPKLLEGDLSEIIKIKER